MTKKLVALLIALATTFALVACGNDDNQGAPNASGDAIAEDEEFNQADVEFATEMIQHHAQALSMVDLITDRTVSAELSALAEQIRMAQGPEIETMVDWLQDWSQPVPETVRDHANAHGDGKVEMQSDMPGMMSAEDMDALAATQGVEFERMWLEMMIEHHEGAVEMATTEKGDGEYVGAIELATAIIGTQDAEIEQMKGMLDS